MSSINKATILGNVGKDPEIRSFPNGGRVASFSIATSESWKDKASGEKKERVTWHNISVLNENLVGIVEKYVKKGSKITSKARLKPVSTPTRTASSVTPRRSCCVRSRERSSCWARRTMQSRKATLSIKSSLSLPTSRKPTKWTTRSHSNDHVPQTPPHRRPRSPRVHPHPALRQVQHVALRPCTHQEGHGWRDGREAER